MSILNKVKLVFLLNYNIQKKENYFILLIFKGILKKFNFFLEFVKYINVPVE